MKKRVKIVKKLKFQLYCDERLALYSASKTNNNNGVTWRERERERERKELCVWHVCEKTSKKIILPCARQWHRKPVSWPA
jgi:hypothetical protein